MYLALTIPGEGDSKYDQEKKLNCQSMNLPINFSPWGYTCVSNTVLPAFLPFNLFFHAYVVVLIHSYLFSHSFNQRIPVGESRYRIESRLFLSGDAIGILGEKDLFIYLFDCTGYLLWHTGSLVRGSSSLTRN